MPNRNFLARMSFGKLKSPKNEHLMVTGEDRKNRKTGVEERKEPLYTRLVPSITLKGIEDGGMVNGNFTVYTRFI